MRCRYEASDRYERGRGLFADFAILGHCGIECLLSLLDLGFLVDGLDEILYVARSIPDMWPNPSVLLLLSKSGSIEDSQGSVVYAEVIKVFCRVNTLWRKA